MKAMKKLNLKTMIETYKNAGSAEEADRIWMNKIIGYKQAKELMQQGYRVKECPQLRGSSIPYLYSPEGITCYRIREDSWRKLQPERRFVKRETFSERSRNAIYIWEYKGDGMN